MRIACKSSVPALNDLVGGRVPMATKNPVAAMPHVKSGELKVLAAPTVRQRIESLGAEPMHMSFKAFTEFVAQGLLTWTGMVKTSGVTVD